MRTTLALISLMVVARVSVVESQVDYYGRLGLTLATRLLRDDVVQEIETRQNLAPTLALGISLPIAPTFRAGLEGTITSSGYYSREQGIKSDLGTLRTGSLLFNLSGPVISRLEWRAGVGVIQYWPADREGIFLRGGSTRLLVGAGVDYRPRLLPQWDLMVSVRYDFQRFTTEELRARRFSGTQAVHRVSAGIGLARGRP